MLVAVLLANAQLREENARLSRENGELRQANEGLRAELEGVKGELAGLAEEIAKLKQGGHKRSLFKGNKGKTKEKKVRRQRADEANQGRRREEPTRIESHRLVVCPECGEELVKQRLSYSRQIIDIPEPQPLEVVEHRVEEGWCGRCRQWHQPAVMWPESVGQGRIGGRLSGLVGYMRSLLRLPYRLIQSFLEGVYRLQVSVGELVNLSHKVEQELAEEVARIKEQARASPYVHMDETGWREDGQNGYIWCLVCEKPQAVRYFEYHQSRAGEVVADLLGDRFAGIVSSDFYSAYNIYSGRHQRCWVHLLRDLAQLRDAYPEDAALVAWCVGVKNLYYLAHDLKANPHAYQPATPRQNVGRLVEMVRQFGLLYAQSDHPCRLLAKRLLRHMDELFLFVLHPDLSADNNLAERALRSLVVQRKVSGGSRSPQGSQTTMRLATLFQTWQARGVSPLYECWRLLGYQPL
jgi:transposase